MAEPAPLQPKPDGRAVRSAKTRRAVAQAYLDLAHDGVLRPTARAVAERARVSERAVFRHFQDLETLMAEAARLQIERVGKAVPQPAPAEGPLEKRLANFVGRWTTQWQYLTMAAFLALILFSPASMLALERGNVDLFIFILCALALLTLENRVWLSAGFFMLATLLKLFPIFAFVAFLQRGKKHFFIISIAASAILLIYAALTYSNIVASYAFTEKGGDLSYGVTVLPLYLHPFLAAPNIYGIFILGSYFAAFGLFGSAVFYGIRSKLLPVADVHHLAAFRLGAAIYVGTFFLGNNWDYRLIFLLFTIPQLVSWGAASRAARWILAMLILSCWYLITLKIFGGLPFGHELVYAVDQICKWGLFAGLIHLFFRVRPWFAEVNEIRRAVSEDADTLI